MLSLLVSLVCVGGQAGALPEVTYTLKFHLKSSAPTLEVQVAAKRLPGPLADLMLELPDHGEWTDVDALYLQDFTSSPLVQKSKDRSTWRFATAPNWDGSIRLSYQLPLIDNTSKLHELHGLLPHVARDQSGKITSWYALSNNVLMRIRRPEKLIEADTTIQIECDADFDIATGWGGISKGSQKSTFEGVISETPIIGGTARVARDTVGSTIFEIAQFAGKDDISKLLLNTAKALIPAYERSTGVPIDRPVRIFAIEKGGGQWLDRACVVQANPMESANSPYYYVFIAHELFHQWLGGYVRRPDETLVWFKEGFTDYFANYHIIGAGLATPEWFAARVLELNREARATPAFDKVAFADPNVAWRADTNEDYAYKGGAILAFCLDAELYSRGKGPLARLISELAKRPDGIYDLESIQAWLRTNGVGDLVDRYIAKPGLPNPRELLPKIGYTLRTVKLSYLGIKTEPGKGRGTVVAIDPEGPAATTDIQVGDVITNTSARLFDRPDIFAPPNEYRFGLELFDPSKGQVAIEVERDGAKHVFRLAPLARGEGHFWDWNRRKDEKTFFNR